MLLLSFFAIADTPLPPRLIRHYEDI